MIVGLFCFVRELFYKYAVPSISQYNPEDSTVPIFVILTYKHYFMSDV
jgi:hypothetical protein